MVRTERRTALSLKNVVTSKNDSTRAAILKNIKARSLIRKTLWADLKLNFPEELGVHELLDAIEDFFKPALLYAAAQAAKDLKTFKGGEQLPINAIINKVNHLSWLIGRGPTVPIEVRVITRSVTNGRT